jgi:hypothetical protein
MVSQQICNTIADGQCSQLSWTIEAADFIEIMPFEPDAVVGPAKIHGNVELAEHAAQQLLALDPDSSSWYVLLSYICATVGMSNKEWDIREINEDKV